eukprot:766496-Pyramimonas_sp.AAC.1
MSSSATPCARGRQSRGIAEFWPGWETIAVGIDCGGTLAPIEELMMDRRARRARIADPGQECRLDVPYVAKTNGLKPVQYVLGGFQQHARLQYMQ